MARAAAARRVALRVLRDQRVRDAHARDLLRGSDAVAALDERDRALATRLVLGVVRTSGLLDALIDSHLSTKGASKNARSAPQGSGRVGRGGKPHLEPRVRDALRIATFELLYLSTPAEVVVSQGVELVRLSNHRAAGLGNAVLRRVAELDVPAMRAANDRLASADAADLESGAAGISAKDVAIVGALPLWLAGAAIESCGAARSRDLALHSLHPPLATVAANLAKFTLEETAALLEQTGCEPKAGPLDGSFVLGRQGRLARSGLVERVDILPCDLAAQEVVQLVAPRPGARVLEVGQGRGTKSILLANSPLASGGPCDVVAVELDPAKSDLSRRRMSNARVAAHVTCVPLDARDLDGTDLPAVLDQAFDLVFVDAPCSGSGTLSRHPEIAWRLTPADVDELANLQLQILSAACARVAPGGRLAYATCSLLRKENESVVDAFLASPQGASFELVAPPHRTTISGADQHFLAQLRRKA